MNRDDHVESTRLLLALHAMVALVVAGSGLLVRAGRLSVRDGWSAGSLAIHGGVLIGAGCVVIVLALVASIDRRPAVVHGCGLAAAAVSVATAVPLALVLGVTGWVVLGAVPLALVSAVGFLGSREPLAERAGHRVAASCRVRARSRSSARMTRVGA